METYFPLSGSLREYDFSAILFHMYSRGINGTLLVHDEDGTQPIRLEVENQKIRRCERSPEDLERHLLQNALISPSAMEHGWAWLKGKSLSIGRALLETGAIQTEALWEAAVQCQREIVFSLFDRDNGRYEIQTPGDSAPPPFPLDLPIPTTVVEGVRRLGNERFVIEALSRTENFHVLEHEIPFTLKLKPWENHVFQLLEHHSHLEELLRRSTLPPFETLRVVYLLWRLEIISDRTPPLEEPEAEPACTAVHPAFNSFEECLNFYNNRYENIYRLVSKEIGPVALTILCNSVDDIRENIPTYFHNIRFTITGRIEESSILKTIWYLKFEENIGDFLRGLEEILFAEIFAVRKHLGKAFEQQILQWLRESGN